MLGVDRGDRAPRGRPGDAPERHLRLAHAAACAAAGAHEASILFALAVRGPAGAVLLAIGAAVRGVDEVLAFQEAEERRR